MTRDNAQAEGCAPPDSVPSTGRWPQFLTHIQRDFKFWLFAFLWLAVFRGVMLTVFAKHLGPGATARAVLKCVLTGARFDMSIATYWALPVALASLAILCGLSPRVAQRIRQVTGGLFAVFSTLLGVVAIGFFSEYKDHFNHWIFGVIFDDFKAVLKTIWAAYPVIPALLALVVGVAATWFLLRWFVSKPFATGDWLSSRLATWPRRGLALGMLLLLIVAGARGSVATRPIQLKDAAVTGDSVLNKMVVNPYSALRYAVNQQFRLMGGSDLRAVWPGRDIREAARVAFPGQAAYEDVDVLTERVAKGPPAARPRHIFLIVMESYDAWPFLERYQSLGLVEGARALGREGVLIRAFVSAGTGTMTSLGALVTGLPEAGAMVNYQRASRKPFPTSVTAIFKQLGYRTRMFYAGYLSWQRIGDFCADQGFEEIYGGDVMAKGRLSREWGVEDDQLFDFVLSKLPADTPSFNLILSAGYHRPFTTDVYGKGFPLRAVPEDIQPMWEGAVSLAALGHLWFADQCLSNFIRRAETQLPDSVIAATGDHWSRDFLNERPNAYEHSAVLMLWHGNGTLPPVAHPERLAGAHLDILPTLVELAAPAGFKYHAFGSNLFDPNRLQLGWGIHATIGPDFVVYHGAANEALKLWDLQPRPLKPEERTTLRQGEALRALGWWRLMKGTSLASDPDQRSLPRQ
ncbi:MAG TPA: LTA synthase family protein [Candidatus Paceibacterota bacterium]|nr:LTA synthase family protein [Verrucomicrobiota bacterium]HSA09913.1 LTA synthase family protein [Candidatus Paceibacterota bacterium]